MLIFCRMRSHFSFYLLFIFPFSFIEIFVSYMCPFVAALVDTAEELESFSSDTPRLHGLPHLWPSASQTGTPQTSSWQVGYTSPKKILCNYLDFLSSVLRLWLFSFSVLSATSFVSAAPEWASGQSVMWLLIAAFYKPFQSIRLCTRL